MPPLLFIGGHVYPWVLRLYHPEALLYSLRLNIRKESQSKLLSRLLNMQFMCVKNENPHTHSHTNKGGGWVAVYSNVQLSPSNMIPRISFLLKYLYIFLFQDIDKGYDSSYRSSRITTTCQHGH